MTSNERPPTSSSLNDCRPSLPAGPDAQQVYGWWDELEHYSSSKTLITISGNIKDAVIYPGERGKIVFARLPRALRNFYLRKWPDSIIAKYNPVDGLLFLDADGKRNVMQQQYVEAIKAQNAKSAADGNLPCRGAVQTTGPVDQAIHDMSNCMATAEQPCVFIIEHASLFATVPTNAAPVEHLDFLRILNASRPRETDRERVPHLVILVCDNHSDIPAWVLAGNPEAGSITLDRPSLTHRHLVFQQLLSTHADPSDTAIKSLADLTDGMMVTELVSIATLVLSRQKESTTLTARGLGEIVEAFRNRGRRSEWQNLPPERLRGVEATLGRVVIGQSEAANSVADVLRRAQLGLSGVQHSSRSKPRGVLFFAGPTGVGKTQMAKEIAKIVFGSEDALIRFDMSEYSQPHTDQRLLGAPPGYVGYNQGGQLTEAMRANPFRVLLFDEIEKADPSILDKFLQILEDGRLTSGRGETVHFSQSILIFTSNAGIYGLGVDGRPERDSDGQAIPLVSPDTHRTYGAVREAVLRGVQEFFEARLGRPELLNRIGHNVVVFNFIREEQMRAIIKQRVLPALQREISERCGVRVEFSDGVVDRLAEICGRNTAAGARGVGNLIEIAVVNPLSRRMFQQQFEASPAAPRRLVVTGIIEPSAENAFQYDTTLDYVVD